MRRLLVSSEGREYQMEIHPVTGASHAFDIRILLGEGGERTHSVQILSRVAGRWTVTLDERRVLDVMVSPQAEGFLVSWNNRNFRVRVSDRNRQFGGSHPQEAGNTVRSEMTGKVVSVGSAEGETVESGQTLAVLEAMKMQNPIRSPRAGRIKACRIVPGQIVSAGETLFEIE